MVPPIPQAAWAAPSSTGTLAGSFAPQSNKIYNLANGGDYSLQSADISNTTFVLSSGSATLRVPANQTVKINDYENGCSPISLGGNAHLTLVVDGTLQVTGGKAGNGANPTGSQAAAGYAGIFVPSGTTLTVMGHGYLTANGGPAGDGGIQQLGVAGQVDIGGGGGGGAGAGIGGNGGIGGTPSRGNGGNGVSAGTINLLDNVKVTANGGAGGAGGGTGTVSGVTATSGGGGGGYPAAGIGGGGAGAGGGDTAGGAGGFSGGSGETGGAKRENGTGGAKGVTSNWHSGGGGYFAQGDTGGGRYAYYKGGLIGGFGGTDGNSASSISWGGGKGGTAGSGGTIRKSNACSLTVNNGTYYTANKQKWGADATPIYAQSGYDLNNIRSANLTAVTARTKAALETELSSKVSKTIAVTNVAGIGSGAGAYEVSNGSFTIQKVPEYCHAVPGHYRVPLIAGRHLAEVGGNASLKSGSIRCAQNDM